MKKLLICLLILGITPCAWGRSYLDSQLKNVKDNIKYNSVKTHKKNYQITPKSNLIIPAVSKNVYDPKLMKLLIYTPIDEKDYEAKLAKDEQIYEKEILPTLKHKSKITSDDTLPIDFYNLYRISERLIRANNLDYINWRIAVRKTEDANAYATDANFIKIYTGLYDTFYNNEDALAFILAHEMSHLILGHTKHLGEIQSKMEQGRISLKASLAANNVIAASTIKAIMLKHLKEMRDMEYMADSEAIILLTRAGYSPQKALEALNTMDTYAEINPWYGWFNTHPKTAKRIESYKENMTVINPEWVEEGKVNIYNSNVLTVKKSSDHVSFVIDKGSNVTDFYNVEDMTQRLSRLAYMSYLNGNYENAVKYFQKLIKTDEENYKYWLYCALANHALYENTKQDKYLKQAQKDLEKAKQFATDNTEIIKVQNIIK